jgi:acetyl esterase/lipase
VDLEATQRRTQRRPFPHRSRRFFEVIATTSYRRDQTLIRNFESGGNLAAIVAHKASGLDPPLPYPLVFQLLVVPVVDNTATVAGPYPSWKELENTAALTPEKMLWFRNNYHKNSDDCIRWDSSPIFAPEASFSTVPDAWIGVCELDILRDEGIAYSKKMKDAGKKVEVRVYEGSPHPIMAMDGGCLK